MIHKLSLYIACCLISAQAYSQHIQKYNLKQLLAEQKLVTFSPTVTPLVDGNKSGITTNKIVWLKGVDFSSGVIECDIRGRDVLQSSFLGIAFHGLDTTTYDAIYFRPFNFQSKDSVRRIHAVQYISEPLHPWHVLREQHPGEYEKGIIPPPPAADWFHARIEVKGNQIKVYVNNGPKPSLTVNKLNDRTHGLIGLWVFDLPGDFANFIIEKK